MRKNSISYLVIIFLALFFLANNTNAQSIKIKRNSNVLDSAQKDPVTVRAGISLRVGSLGQFGFENPYLAVGPSLEVENSKFLLGANLNLSPTDKICCGNTNGLNFDLDVFGKIPVGKDDLKGGKNNSILIGGGIGYGRLDFKDTKDKIVKSGASFSLKAGVQNKKYRVKAYGGPVWQTDKANHGRGFVGRFSIDPLHNLRFGVEISNFSFDVCSFNPACGRKRATGAVFFFTFYFLNHKFE